MVSKRSREQYTLAGLIDEIDCILECYATGGFDTDTEFFVAIDAELDKYRAEASPTPERTEVERLRLALTRAMDRGNAYEEALEHIVGWAEDEVLHGPPELGLILGEARHVLGSAPVPEAPTPPRKNTGARIEMPLSVYADIAQLLEASEEREAALQEALAEVVRLADNASEHFNDLGMSDVARAALAVVPSLESSPK